MSCPYLRCQPPLLQSKRGQCSRVRIVNRCPATVLQQCRNSAGIVPRRGSSSSVGVVRCARRGSPRRAA
jgi:hypothetical protein